MQYKLLLLIGLISMFFIINGKPSKYQPNLPPGGKLVIVNEVKSGIRRRRPCARNIKLLSQHMHMLLSRVEDSLNLIYSRNTAIAQRIKNLSKNI